MAQSVRQDIHTTKVLLEQSRAADNVRQSHRILAIRDILCGNFRSEVCIRYGVSRENLRHWVSWYNECGVTGLKDGVRCGRPKKIENEKISAFKERVEKQPDPQKDAKKAKKGSSLDMTVSDKLIYTHGSSPST